MSTKRKSRIPDPFEPAPVSAFGELRDAEMIRLADAGNTDAGHRLLEWASLCLERKRPMSEALRAWLAERLKAVTKEPEKAGQHLRLSPGKRPPAHAESMRDRLDWEAFQDRIAWAVFRAQDEGPMRANSTGGKTAPQIISEWANGAARKAGIEALRAAQEGRKADAEDLERAAQLTCSEDQARAWFYERRERIKAREAEIEEIIKELGGMERSG